MRPDSVCRLMPKKDSSVQGKVHETVQTLYPKRCLIAFYVRLYVRATGNYISDKFNKYTSISSEKYREQVKARAFC